MFQKHLVKKIFVEERGFKDLVSPFKRRSSDEAGKVKLAQGVESTSLSQTVLRQFGIAKELDVLCQGEVDPFLGESHLPTPRAKTGE